MAKSIIINETILIVPSEIRSAKYILSKKGRHWIIVDFKNDGVESIFIEVNSKTHGKSVLTNIQKGIHSSNE